MRRQIGAAQRTEATRPETATGAAHHTLHPRPETRQATAAGAREHDAHQSTASEAARAPQSQLFGAISRCLQALLMSTQVAISPKTPPPVPEIVQARPPLIGQPHLPLAALTLPLALPPDPSSCFPHSNFPSPGNKLLSSQGLKVQSG